MIGLELAKLHSQAVDYPKSGIPAKVPRHLYPRQWPHFMEKGRPAHQTYHSTTALGEIYDVVQVGEYAPQYESAFDPRVLNAYQLTDEMLAKAASIKEDYDNTIRRIMAQNAIRTEFEVFSAFVLSHNFEKKDYSFAEELGHTVSMLKSRFREMCAEEAGSKDFNDLGPFVAAMYTVTARQIHQALEDRKTAKVSGTSGNDRLLSMEPKDMPFLTFPWIFDRELGRIAHGGYELERVKAAQGGQKKNKITAGRAAAAAATIVETEAGPVRQDEDLILFDSPPRPRKAVAPLESLESGKATPPTTKSDGEGEYDEETAALKEKQHAAHVAMVEAGIKGREPTAINHAVRRRQLFDPKTSVATEWAPGAKMDIPASDSGVGNGSGVTVDKRKSSSDELDQFEQIDMDEFETVDASPALALVAADTNKLEEAQGQVRTIEVVADDSQAAFDRLEQLISD